MCTINIEEKFNPNRTNASINIVTYAFKMKFCKEYIAQYKGKDNYIFSGNKIKNLINKTMHKMRRHRADINQFFKDLESSKNIKATILIKTIAMLVQIIPSAVVGPDILDPIIIEINQGTIPTIHKIVENYATSPIHPIIILLLDEETDEETVNSILQKLPVNLKIAIHDDNGNTKVYSVIKNKGAENIGEFIDAYSYQCFSTCASTSRQIIINDLQNSDKISLLSSLLLKSHSSLLIDNKIEAQKDIKEVYRLLSDTPLSETMSKLFKCINDLNAVYANDRGGGEILEAIRLSKELGSPLITAFVNRYAHFIPRTNYDEKVSLLDAAATVFEKNNIMDHKLYCINNALTYSFYTDCLNLEQFDQMLSEAVSNVPGLAGMSILYNNVGTAYLYNRNAQDALVKFKTGMDYANSLNRPAQRIGLIGNIAIAQSLSGDKISIDEFINSSNDIMHMPNTRNLPFIQINGLMNLIAAALYQNNIEAAKYIRQNKEFKNIMSRSLQPNVMGTGSLVKQIEVLTTISQGLLDFSEFNCSVKASPLSGIRGDYIEEHGFNPAIGNAWL